MTDLTNEHEFITKRKEIMGFDKFSKSVTWHWDRTNEEYFKRALRIASLEGSEEVLDFGAGICWASYTFSKLGCNTIALDYNISESCGLLSVDSWWKDHRALNFNRVAGDAEYLPFSDCSFDVAFCHASLHHAYDLKKMVREIARVVKNGGRMIAISEVTRPLFSSEKEKIKSHIGSSFGINEHYPTVLEYLRAFEIAGMKKATLVPTVGWNRLFCRLGRNPNPIKKGLGRLLRHISKNHFGRVITKIILLYFVGNKIDLFYEKERTSYHRAREARRL